MMLLSSLVQISPKNLDSAFEFDYFQLNEAIERTFYAIPTGHSALWHGQFMQ